VVLVGEPLDLAGVADDLRSDDRGHPGTPVNVVPDWGDERPKLVGQGLDPSLKGSQADDQVAGELLAAVSVAVTGRTRRSRSAAWRVDGCFLAPPGDQVAQQPVQPVMALVCSATRSSRWSLTRRITLLRSSA
jgi:hypothetical protein